MKFTHTVEAETRKAMVKHLRAAANSFDSASVRSWEFWIGSFRE